MKKYHVLILTILLLLTACSPTTEVSPSKEPLESLSEPTAEITKVPPTDTLVPSKTPEPTITNTPISSNTPTITPTFSPDTLSFAPGEPIRIGYLLWESHPLGIDSLRGAEIAIGYYGGEILGHPVELTGFDSECSELAAQRGSQILVRDDTVIGIIGTTCSIGALRAAPIVSDGNRVMISPSNSLAELTVPDSRSAGYFRTSPNDLFQVNAVAQYAYNELGARKMATVYAASNIFKKLQSNALCDAFTALGGECILERTMEDGSTYMAPIINSLVEADPDAIYFMGGGIQEGAAFLSEASTTPGLEDAALFFWDRYSNADFLQQAGENVLGVYVSVTSYDFNQTANAYQTFLNTYHSNYGEDPLSIYHAYTYDAATLLLMAVAQVAVRGEDGSLMIDPLAVRDALYVLDEFSGLTGLISCSQFGDCATSTIGKVYEFTSGDPGTFNPGPADSLSSNPSQVWP
jgi:branched-chain amino acid transport system substrate-binding protein